MNIGTFTATGSNVILGDAINSSLNVDNSIQRIEKRIEDDEMCIRDRDKENIDCPYCGETNGTVMTSGFVYTRKIEDDK